MAAPTSNSLPLAHTLTSITVLAFNHEHSCLQAATGGDGPNVIVEMLSNVNLQHDLEMIKFQGRILVSAEIIYFGPFFFFPLYFHDGKMSTVTVVVSDWSTCFDRSYSGECRDYLFM